MAASILELESAPPSAHYGAPDTTGFQVIRRSGVLSAFDQSKISIAITKAFIAVEGTSATSSRRIHEAVDDLTGQIVGALSRRADQARALHIEDIQDQVELALMRSGEHKVARAYVLYRGERSSGVCSPLRSRLRRGCRCGSQTGACSHSTKRAFSRRFAWPARNWMGCPSTR
jgi:hypothetical protein